ncbi:efflux RND transporter periplasmic adaptor subunit [Luteimonas aquatica]|uniref:efflux RND transporter periplasmic adaptor subunit n=1 Tax=Luteimonas aquatica TaxID=450364 RepID=UPI001F5605B2|nr:efflux RND transporter periplasmic adaptor subunit [Luteimonas aquatica]
MLAPPVDRRRRKPLAAALLCLALAACGGGAPAEKNADAKNKTVEVGYVVMQPTSVALTSEFNGRAVAFESSEVRPQVGGLVRRQFFQEGSLVRAGAPLYQIDSSLYQAAVDQAEADLKNARAALGAADALARRNQALVGSQLISRQDYDNAAAAADQARANVAQREASLATARINLRFTTVPAPIDGRIGRSLVTVGALVTPDQAAPLATIQRLDPIYVDVQQSAQQLLALRQRLAAGDVQPADATARILLPDGSAYPQPGTLQFSEVLVDESTGTVTLRIRVPNPDGLLLPGMFVRARIAQATQAAAYRLPQAALVRGPTGDAFTWVVGPGDRAVQRPITADRADGADWIVTAGLQPGDRVITQGIASLRPDTPLRPVAASTPQRLLPPSSTGSKPASSRPASAAPANKG